MFYLLNNAQAALDKKLAGAKRISTSGNWFEVIKLPNDICACYETKHSDSWQNRDYSKASCH